MVAARVITLVLVIVHLDFPNALLVLFAELPKSDRHKETTSLVACAPAHQGQGSSFCLQVNTWTGNG